MEKTMAKIAKEDLKKIHVFVNITLISITGFPLKGKKKIICLS